MWHRSVRVLPSTVFFLLVVGFEPEGQTLEDFEVLDNVEGEVGFNPVPRRPMALWESGSVVHLYAVNTHNSTVLHFGSSSTPDVFQVPRSPVSIAVWSDPEDTAYPTKLVVVCDGTYCLVVLDAASGETLGLMELRGPGADAPIMGEPGDLLVDSATKRAFVSCAAADAVLEVDLEDLTPELRYELPAKDPVFMCFDRDGHVLVAPMLSGNNSGARRIEEASGDPFNTQHAADSPVLDLETADLSGGGLPDEDLFRCVTSGTSHGAVEAVTRGMGTVLFACGIQPGTDTEDPEVIWQLNTEANNKDSRQTEGDIRGDIVQNRISVAHLPAVGAGTPATPTHSLDLDLGSLTGGSYDDARSVGQPYSLVFTGTESPYSAVVCGLLTDNLMVIDPDETEMVEVRDLDPGSIPRGLLYSPTDNHLYVYCWGTSTVDKYEVETGLPLVEQLDLGHDPMPADLREGRRILYDASNSEKNNASCASCHVEGRTDMVVWNLSKGPMDDKGPMVTQTLAGIEKLGPFHWRGEQAGLIDFNPAFVNLLGAEDVLGETDFDKFQRFVFSIQNRPNPFESEERKIDSSIQPPLIESLLPSGFSSAVASNGKDEFMGASFDCERCHNFPLGTGGTITPDGASLGEQNPHRMHLKAAPFHDLYKKEQDADKLPTAEFVQTVPITLANLDPEGEDEEFEYPLLGTGVSHAGLIANFHEFTSSSIFPFPLLSQQERADITAFTYQWDQGVAPAAYRAVLLEPGPELSALWDRASWLVAQAELRNCDVVVYGESTISGSTKNRRWYYLRDNDTFYSEESSVSRSPNFFLSQANGSGKKHVYVGLPVGVGLRFGIDYDGDDVLNGDEEENEVYVPNSDPGDEDPPSILRSATTMVTARAARINVETDEPCTVTIEYWRKVGTEQLEMRSKSTDVFARTHSILLTDLLPSTDVDGSITKWNTYDGVVKAFDRADNQSVGTHEIPDMPSFNQGLPGGTNLPITTRAFEERIEDHLKRSVIGNLAWPSGSWGTPGGLKIVPVRVDQKVGGPPTVPQVGVRAVARLFVNGVLNTDFLVSGTSLRIEDGSLLYDPPGTVGEHAFTGIPGPYLVSQPTSSTGTTYFRFKVPSLTSGDELTLNIEFVVEPFTGSGYESKFVVPAIDWYDKSSTPAQYRSITH